MDNKMKKAMVLAAAAVMCVGTCMARPHGGPGGGPRGGGPRPVMGPGPGGHHGGGHHHHGGGWGRGGRNFWPGFVGGVVGGALYDAVVGPTVVAPTVVAPAPVVVTPAPVVVTPPTPVYTTQNVWVEGRYVDQVGANGAVIRVWQPGHYEQRQVIVQ